MQQNKKYYSVLIALVFVGIASLGLLIYQKVEEEKQIKIIFVSKKIESSEFWLSLVNGAKLAATEYKVDFQVVAPSREEDYLEQNELIAVAIKEKPDVIVLSPADYEGNTAAAQRIKKSGIKLVLIDSVLSEDIADVVVATNNEKAGLIIGKYAEDLCKDDTNIGIVSHVKGSSTAIEREKGFREGLGKKEDSIVETVYSDSKNKAYEVTKKLILEQPEINMVVGLNEYSTVGAARAIKDMGLAKEIIIVGFDNTIEEVQFLEAGVIEGIVIQRSFEMGYLGIQKAVDLARGISVPKNIDSDAKLVTRDTIYTEENQKLLFPF